MKKLQIDESQAKKLYKTASKEFKQILHDTFGEAFFSEKITDRIKGIDDVFEELGTTYEQVVPWKNPKNKKQKSQNALALIQCITEVYNEGVELDWYNPNQPKYYSWFEKKALGGGWVFGCCCCGYAGADVGFSCYFTKEENCKDAVKKFMSIYKDYLPE